MAQLVFTQQLARFVEAPAVITSAPTLREALEDAFRRYPRLRGYLLDDQGDLRQHVAVFIDGRRLREPRSLDLSLSPESTIHFLQALSGG